MHQRSNHYNKSAVCVVCVCSNEITAERAGISKIGERSFRVIGNGTITQITYNFRSVCHCKHNYILYQFQDMSHVTLKNIVTLTFKLGVSRAYARSVHG